jgi:hypothetical protein
MTRSVYVGPEWPDGGPEPEAQSHFYCANAECPSAFGNGHGPVPNTRKYRVPGGYICELCAEVHDSETGGYSMIDVLNEIRRTHQILHLGRYAGATHVDDEETGRRVVKQLFEVELFALNDVDRQTVIRLHVGDDLAAGVNKPDDHPHYPLTGDKLLEWKVWSTVLADLDRDGERAPVWSLMERLFGADGLHQILATYRAADKPDHEAQIPTRNRFLRESGHRLANTGRGYNNNPHGAFLFRCVDCKRLARVADFREHECWIPALIDLAYREDFRQLVFHFVHRVNDSGSMPFAIWHREATEAVLYSAEGSEMGRLTVAEGIEFDDLLAAVIDEWGALATVQFSSRQYPSGE